MISSRRTLDQDLITLSDNLTKLASLTSNAIIKATESLEKNDITLARRVVNADEEINHLRTIIEKEVQRILALQQPQVSDLRHVLLIYTTAGELERIADHASGISRLVLRIFEEGNQPAEALYQLPKMARRAHKMLEEAISSYLKGDVELAKKVIDRDNKLNRQYGNFASIMFDEMNASDADKEVTVPTYLLWMAHNLERIGDRVTNICERVIFYITGEYFEGD